MKVKKIVSFFLVFCMILGFTACVQNEKTESGDTNESSGMTETPADKEFTAPDPLPSRINYAKGCDYTVSLSAHDSYPDGAKKLTDGEFSVSNSFDYKTGSGDDMRLVWVGFNSPVKEDITIDLNLNKKHEDISELELFTLQNTGAGIGLPGRIDFYISDNGNDYTLAGTSLPPTKLSGDTKYTANIVLEKTVSAQYVRFVISEIKSSWIFVEEVCVYAYGQEEEKTASDSYFKEVEIPYISEPSYWDSSDDDYNTRQNLILGLSHQMSSEQELAKDIRVEHYNNTETCGLLTDGKKETETDYSTAKWFHCTKGFARSIYYTLENISALDSVEIGLIQDGPVGIYLPQWIDIIVSEDGENWQTVASKNNITAQTDPQIVRVTLDFDASYRVKYLRIVMRIDIHCWIDEIEAFGTKNTEGAKEITGESLVGSYVDAFPLKEDFDMSDVLLAYLDTNTENAVSSRYYIPQIAYYKDGEPVDWMFETFMFLPNSSFYTHMSTKEEWDHYFDMLFMDGAHIKAVDEAVSKVKEKLNDPDYKLQVIFSIPQTHPDADFGEINGHALDMTKTEDRNEAIKWYIDRHIQAFNDCGFKNLTLTGFYWHEEGIDYADKGNVENVKYFNEYVKSLGYYSTWIPYYMASGFDSWSELGFSIANMQPNYAFDLGVPKSRLYDSIKLSKRFGLGVELEIHSLGNADYVRRMKEYFYVCAELGVMHDTVHMYYTAGMPGAVYESFISSDPYMRSLYDSIGMFIDGTFASSVSGPDEATFIGEEGKETISGTLTGNPADYVINYQIALSPQNGTIRIEPDGTFKYTPNQGFSGTDYFEVRYDYGFMMSNASRITIEVK